MLYLCVAYPYALMEAEREEREPVGRTSRAHSRRSEKGALLLRTHPKRSGAERTEANRTPEKRRRGESREDESQSINVESSLKRLRSFLLNTGRVASTCSVSVLHSSVLFCSVLCDYVSQPNVCITQASVECTSR